jgi:hypothetical protein
MAHARTTSTVWAPAALAALAGLLYGKGHLGYDASWALVWGEQIASGHVPRFQAPGAPTPHPLANIATALLAPFGGTAGSALIAICTLSFGVLVWAAYLLGRRLFGVPVGALFALILFTRPELVNEAGQALIDIPFLALVVGAAAMEARHPRRGLPVLVLLTLAGLLRPEAWLLSAAYVAYLLPGRSTRARARFLALSASAPLAWAALDLVVTGDPLYSLHGTRELAAQLDRPRDLQAALRTAPHALENVLGAPVALVGLAGCLAAVFVLYERALLPAAMIGLGLVAFVGIGMAGLPVLPRYLLGPVVMLALFCAVGALGWTQLRHGDRRRRRWMAASVLLSATFVLSIPHDLAHHRELRHFLDQRRTIQADLQALAAAALPITNGRGSPVRLHVTAQRAVPLLAFWLGRPPDQMSASPPPRRARARLIAPASGAVAVNYALKAVPRGPPMHTAWREIYRNKSWVLYEAPTVR